MTSPTVVAMEKPVIDEFVAEAALVGEGTCPVCRRPFARMSYQGVEWGACGPCDSLYRLTRQEGPHPFFAEGDLLVVWRRWSWVVRPR